MKLGKPLYGHRIKGYDVGHELTWRYECELKNNSKFEAYNIQLFEIEAEDPIISNKAELQYSFQENNHLGSNESKEFEIKKTISVGPEVLIKSTTEDGKRIILPGLKIQQPELKLRPECLNKIRLIVKYENERGKCFYTKFTRFSDNEISKVNGVRPFWWKKLKTEGLSHKVCKQKYNGGHDPRYIFV